jgi:multidrug resistance efflux pump
MNNRIMNKYIHSIFLLLCFSLLLSACKADKEKKEVLPSNPAENNMIVGVANVEPQGRIVSLYAEVGGIVEQINYDINDSVKKDQVIIKLDALVEQAQLQQAQSKISTQKAAIEVAKAQLASAQVKLNNAKTNYERNQRLKQFDGVSQQLVDDSKFAYESAQSDLTSAQANLSERNNQLKEQETDIAYFQKVIDRKSIKAPADGKLLSMDVRVGNSVNSSQAVADFAPAGNLIAITEVDELYANKVEPGLTAYIRPQGAKDTLAMGKVILCSPYLRKKSLFSDNAANMEDRRVREVRVLLNESSKVLIGSRVECVIILNK